MYNKEGDIIRQAHLGHVDGAQIVVEEAIPGKRIKPGQGSIKHDDMYGYLILRFDDDTWAAWEPDAYGETIIFFRDNRLEPEALRYSGLLTDDEYETYQADIASRYTENRNRERRKMYETLKAEFESDNESN